MRLLLTAALAVGCAPPAPAAGLTAGAATADITPPRGTPMAGYYSARAAEGTHDPLLARAIVIEKDGTRAALVVLDLITTTHETVAEARKQIEAGTGIPGRNVMISATHTHTGPEVRVSRRAEAFGATNRIVRDYLAGLPKTIADAVKKADAARRPARVSFAAGREDGLAFNRRFHMRDGTVGWNAGKLNPNIVRPAGPTDPAVPVVLFETADGKTPIATYVNFAMHLDTVGGMEFSADYVFTLSKCLAAVKGDGVVTVFATGCCGDINHINVSHKFPQKGHAEAARIGTRLAAEVLRTYEKLEPAADGPLRVTAETVELALPPVTPEELAEAKEVAARVQSEAKPAPKFLDQVRAFQAIDVAGRLGKPHAVEVQVISLGDDLAWVSLPGEIFVELGLAIKAGSPFRQTMTAELANGSIGYVPNRVAYPQGNYEVVSARCAAGSGEKLVDAALSQLRAQFREARPAHK